LEAFVVTAEGRGAGFGHGAAGGGVEFGSGGLEGFVG